MRRKISNFIDLLETYFSEYLPYSAGLSENTIKSYKYAFRLLMQFLFETKGITASNITFEDISGDTVNEFMLWLENERSCSISTRNLRLSALSSFADYAQNRSFEVSTAFMKSVKAVPVKKDCIKPRTIFTQEETTLLLNLPNRDTRTGLRDKVLLNLMYASGARAQEICDLCVRNVQVQNDNVRLTISGKGNKTRRILIAAPCGRLLCKYIEYREIAQLPDAHIFSSLTHEHMTVSCIEEIFKKYIRLAREQHPNLFMEKSYTPHTMRHTTATHMLEAGVPMMAIKNFLGHSSLKTTERYAELSQGTVNKHIADWNRKWYSDTELSERKSSRLPDFLNL